MNVTIYRHNKSGYIEITDEGIDNRTLECIQVINNDLKKAHMIAPKTKLKWKDF